MKTILLTASALSLLAIAPASAQTMMGDGMARGRSCVSGGQFVPCPGTGGMVMMNPRMEMDEPGMYPPEMSAREERRMMRRQRM